MWVRPCRPLHQVLSGSSPGPLTAHGVPKVSLGSARLGSIAGVLSVGSTVSVVGVVSVEGAASVARVASVAGALTTLTTLTTRSTLTTLTTLTTRSTRTTRATLTFGVEQGQHLGGERLHAVAKGLAQALAHLEGVITR